MKAVVGGSIETVQNIIILLGQADLNQQNNVRCTIIIISIAILCDQVQNAVLIM